MENMEYMTSLNATYDNLYSQVIETLNELFKYSDEQIEQVKDSYFKELAKAYSGEDAYRVINETIKQAEKTGFSKSEIIEEYEANKEILMVLFDRIKQDYIESATKQEVIEEIQKNIMNYMDTFILQVMNQDKPNVYVELIHPEAKIPTYAHPGDQGADIYAVEEITIPPHSYGNMIPTGIKMMIPEGWAISIRPRSGLSKNTTLRISNSPATIDTAYRGEVKVLMDNIGDSPVTIQVGERIAQMLIERNYQMNLELIDSVNVNTERGLGGFGSSGN
jgi:dUTP pyrophosphatase